MRYLVKKLDPVRPAGAPTAAAVDDGSVLFPLGVEPFVGPVRVGLSEGRGRGLFVTEDVPAGRLLLCAHAAATGENGEKIRNGLKEAMRRNPYLHEARWRDGFGQGRER